MATSAKSFGDVERVVATRGGEPLRRLDEPPARTPAPVRDDGA